MSNRIVCGISGATIEAYDKDDLILIFSVVSSGAVGPINSQLPFIIDVNFKDKLIPNSKDAQKDFRRFAYFIISEYTPKIIELETRKETILDLKAENANISDMIDQLINALSRFHYDQYEVQFKTRESYGDLSIVPFVAYKSQFDIIKDNDFNVNYFIQSKEDLYKWICETHNRKLRKKIMAMCETKEEEDNYFVNQDASPEQFLKAINHAIIKNDFSYINSTFLESFFFQPSIFKTIGLYGKVRKGMVSFHKMIETYWVIFKMQELNINFSQSSAMYPKHFANNNIIKLKELQLSDLKNKFK